MEFELLKIMRSTEICARNNLDEGKPRTPKSDPCLFCEARPPESQIADNAYYWMVPCEHGEDINERYYPGQSVCFNKWREPARKDRIGTAVFFMAEVEAYEQAHGLGPLPHAPVTAEALVDTLRAAGITDAGMIARMVKAAFPETNHVELGLLLAGEEKAKKMKPYAATKTAQRALKSK
jgi:hypothetical protein